MKARIPRSVLLHPMYSVSDYTYLAGKGYTNVEIKRLWDRDQTNGSKPVVHKQKFDIVGYVNGRI